MIIFLINLFQLITQSIHLRNIQRQLTLQLINQFLFMNQIIPQLINIITKLRRTNKMLLFKLSNPLRTII